VIAGCEEPLLQAERDFTRGEVAVLI